LEDKQEARRALNLKRVLIKI
jgi:hypothetical protein